LHIIILGLISQGSPYLIGSTVWRYGCKVVGSNTDLKAVLHPLGLRHLQEVADVLLLTSVGAGPATQRVSKCLLSTIVINKQMPIHVQACSKPSEYKSKYTECVIVINI
jgi:hypothetical protein